MSSRSFDVRTMIRTSAGVLLLAGALGFASGCETSREQAIHDDPAMGLQTLADRPEDVDNTLNTVQNEDWRMFWQDLGRAMYTDRPSKLTPEPIPYR